MATPIFLPDRRSLIAGFGAAAVSLFLPGRAAAAGGPRRVALAAEPGTLALRPDHPEVPVWALTPAGPLRARAGESLEIAFQNRLPVPAVLNWRGLDGAAAADPLTARPPTRPGGEESFVISLPYAGTFMCELWLAEEGRSPPARPLALVVEEREAVAADREQILLIEEFWLRPDGTTLAPGADAQGTTPVYAVNGLVSPEIAVRANERLRFRIINGCQRTVIALKFENQDVRVMALDGQPAEPFPARNGALVLAPGGRADAFIDIAAMAAASSPILLHDGREARAVARLVASHEPPVRPAPLSAGPPLPANGLPAGLDLKNALRLDLSIGGSQADWIPPSRFAGSSPPAFRAKAGQTVVLALGNHAAVPTVFHLHGHHFRLLDRLDDGWKPYWLDTLAVEPGETQRIAFLAEHPGRWLIEQVATDRAAPRLVRWYSVE